jgi:hypothetical protein
VFPGFYIKVQKHQRNILFSSVADYFLKKRQYHCERCRNIREIPFSSVADNCLKKIHCHCETGTANVSYFN